MHGAVNEFRYAGQKTIRLEEAHESAYRFFAWRNIEVRRRPLIRTDQACSGNRISGFKRAVRTSCIACDVLLFPALEGRVHADVAWKKRRQLLVDRIRVRIHGAGRAVVVAHMTFRFS
jgi:hypothetical protein